MSIQLQFTFVNTSEEGITGIDLYYENPVKI